jgi:hypothetical protein
MGLQTSGPALIVVALADGTVTGCPWAGYATSYSGTATNDRGWRFQVPVKTTIYGVYLAPIATSFVSGAKLYSGASELAAATNYYQNVWVFAAPYICLPNVTYDIVLKMVGGGASSSPPIPYKGAASPPAAVTACVPTTNGVPWQLVTGGTPGSYTADATRMMCLQLLVDDYPAGGGLLVNRGMSGGLNG